MLHASCVGAPSGEVSSPLQMEIRLTPSAHQAPTKTKNLAGNFAARTATVAAARADPAAGRAAGENANARPGLAESLGEARHHVLDDRVVLERVDAQVLAVAGLLEAAVGHL